MNMTMNVTMNMTMNKDIISVILKYSAYKNVINFRLINKMWYDTIKNNYHIHFIIHRNEKLNLFEYYNKASFFCIFNEYKIDTPNYYNIVYLSIKYDLPPINLNFPNLLTLIVATDLNQTNNYYKCSNKICTYPDLLNDYQNKTIKPTDLKINAPLLKSFIIGRGCGISNERLNEMAQLTNLEIIANNNITNISTLTNLERLLLYNNNKIIDISSLVNLTELGLLGLNSLSEFSNPSLCSLNLAHNKHITHIPNKITHLNISGKSIINDETLMKSTQLTQLYMQNNLIITNNGIKNLCNLKILDISNHNRITDNGLKNLVNIEFLYIYNNPDTHCQKILSAFHCDSQPNITGSTLINMTKLKYLNILYNPEIKLSVTQLLETNYKTKVIRSSRQG